jgi:NitT/TauT family transport system permease protein
LSEVEPDLLDLVKSLRGSRLDAVSENPVTGRAALCVSGMKVGAILAVAGAIVGGSSPPNGLGIS